MPAGGNFDSDVQIGKVGEINPSGTLGDLVDRGTVHLHFWVIQMKPGKKGAFMQGQGIPQVSDPTRWVTRPLESLVDPETGKPVDITHRHGTFVQGQAFATAVAMLDDDEIDWWSATINLNP
jgi:hypothetical protein